MSSDRFQRVSIAAAVLLVAAIAAVISFIHIRELLAATHGQTPLAAVLLPFSIDGTVLASSLVLLRAAQLQLRAPWLAQVMLLSSVLVTLAANVLYGLPWRSVGGALSGWPAVAFIGCAEMAIMMVRRAALGPGTVPATPRAGAVPAVSVGVSVPRREPVREVMRRHKVSQATVKKMRAYAAEQVRASTNGHVS